MTKGLQWQPNTLIHQFQFFWQLTVFFTHTQNQNQKTPTTTSTRNSQFSHTHMFSGTHHIICKIPEHNRHSHHEQIPFTKQTTVKWNQTFYQKQNMWLTFSTPISSSHTQLVSLQWHNTKHYTATSTTSYSTKTTFRLMSDIHLNSTIFEKIEPITKSSTHQSRMPWHLPQCHKILP